MPKQSITVVLVMMLLSALFQGAISTAFAAYAPDGSGTLNVSPTAVTASATNQTFTFTYTAAAGGMDNGTISIGVSRYSLYAGKIATTKITSTTGTASYTEDMLKVTGVTLAGGEAVTITWSGVTITSADSATGSYSLSAKQKSTISGTLYSIRVLSSVKISKPPSATTSQATGVSATAASLNGTVADNWAATTVSFDYGTTTSYGTNVAATTNGSIKRGGGSKDVAATISGLACGGTTYHYRVKGVNSSGTTNGADMTFTTTACPPVTITSANTSANMTTLALQSDSTGAGYFTLLKGSGTSCGTSAMVKGGKDANGQAPGSSGSQAVAFGSLALTAKTPANYTVRNLKASTPYTVCFTADKNGVLATPISANITTQAVATHANPGWIAVGQAGFSAGVPDYTSLAFAPDGTPYVAYQDYGNSGKATVKKYDGTSWSTVGSAGFSAGESKYISLAFAFDATPYVAYLDGGRPGKKATVKKYNGTVWVTVGSASFTNEADYISLAIAPDGAPYVAYQEFGSTYSTTVMKYNGTSWSTVGSASFTNKADDISLAFAPDGTPYVAYKDRNKEFRATVMKYNGTGWVTVGTAGFSSEEVSRISLVFSPDGTPYVAYRAMYLRYKATVMKYDGTAWVAVGPFLGGEHGFSAGSADYISLAFAADGTPHVAYLDGKYKDKATVMKYNGTGWVEVGSAGFSAGSAVFNSLAFAPDGSPYLAYQDGGSSNKATVMRLVNVLFPPAVTTGSASSLSTTGATLGGTVSANGAAATVSFDYGTSSTPYSNSVTAGQSTLALNAVNSTVSASVSEMACNTTYHFRGKAVNSQGTTNGSDATFTTSACPPAATTGSATVTPTGVTLGGTVSAQGAATTVSFDYGTSSTPYSNTVTAGPSSLAASAANTAVSASLSGLACNTTYHFRVKAVNSAATTTSLDQTFTVPCAPVVSTPVASAAANMATLTLQADAAGAGWFTLLPGTGAACGTGSQVRAGQDATGNAAFRRGSLPLTANTPASYTVRNLTQSTPYTVCFTADNAGGTSAPKTINLTTQAAATYANPGWIAAGTVSLSADDLYTSLVFAPDGTPYLAYKDGGNSSMATVKKYDGTAWIAVGSAGFSAGSASFTTLAFAPDGTPYVAYMDLASANGDRATVKKFDGTAWTSVGSEGFSTGGVNYTSLAFAADGTPYLAYQVVPGSKPTVVKFDGAAWSAAGPAAVSETASATYTSLAVAPDGTPYLAYIDAANQSKAAVMKFNGTSWTAVGSAAVSDGFANHASLAIAPDGTPYVAYQDSTAGGTTVKKYDGTAWNTVGSAGFSNAKSAYNSLAFAPDGTPYLAYRDSSKKDRATVMKYDGTAWSTVGTAGFSTRTANYISLAFAPDGTPYLAYRDAGPATVMRLGNVVAPPIAVTGAAGGISVSGATLNATVNSKGAATTVIFDYGTSTSYDTNLAATTGGTIAAGNAATPAALTLTGLACNTTYHFRVAAVNSAGAINGGDATFTTSACPIPPAIGAHPANATVDVGNNAQFTVTATGDALTYQWQVNNGSGFGNIANGGVYSGATTPTLAITGATGGMNGYSYRVVVSGAGSPAATSSGATLTVSTPPAITTQPTGARVHSGVTTQFTVTATGTGLTYQWQLSTDNGVNFSNISNDATYNNATTANLSVANVNVGMDGYKYRVVVSGSLAPAVTSDSATLSVLTIALPITSGTWTNPPWSAPGGNATVSGTTITLTPNQTSKSGYIFLTDPFAASLGLNVTFDYTSSGGGANGGDGLSFFLIDGSANPTTPGALGGALGYSKSGASATDGLAGAWVGIGFDEYGNFSATPDGTAKADSVAVRGQTPGFAFIANGNPSFAIDGGSRKVNITIDKTQKITVQISADNGVTWETPINAVSLGQVAPATFKLGFAAGTGGATNLHQVSNVVVTLPGDNALTGSGLTATAAKGATVNFTLQLCPQNNTVLQADTKAQVALSGSGLSFTQTSYGPYDLSKLSGGSCVDIPVSATVTANGGQPYSYTATVSSVDAGFGDVDLANNKATQSGTVLTPPAATTGAASGVTATGATLNGTVTANSADTTVSFDYGTSTGYGTNTAATTGGTLIAGSGATAAAVTLPALTCNTTYHFRVNGVSSSGATNGSDATFLTSPCVPDAPTGATATAGDTQATVTFTAPVSNGGAAITGYTVTSSPDNKTAAWASGPLSLTVTGLTNGTAYTFTVTATNSAGTSAPSAASGSVTPKANQSIGAITFSPATLAFGGSTMASATATSGLMAGFGTTTAAICSVNGAAITGKSPGTCTVTADQAGNDSWNAAPQVTKNITVDKAAQSISFEKSAVTRTYGDKDFGPGATASSGLGLTYTCSDTNVATITAGGLIHIVGAGTATITASQTGDANYLSASANLVLTVDKAKLTIAAKNATRDYAAADPAFTAAYSGFVNGETAAVLSGAPAFTTDADSSSAPGSYTITPALGTLSAANYALSFVTGALAVDIVTQTITFNPLKTRTYGAAPFTLSATGGASGNPIVFASSNTAVATVDGSTVTIVGPGETVIIASQAEAPGYASAKAQQTMTVKKASLMVTARSAERFYGEPDPLFDVSYDGFVSGQDQSVLTGSPGITTTATAASPAGSYPITPATGTLASANYEFIFNNGTLAVNLALQEIAFEKIAAKTYGTAAFNPGATGGGSGNPVVYSSSDPAVATVNGSTITITGAGQAIITASQTGNDYYAPGTARRFLTVEPTALIVTATDKSRVFGTANPALTVTYGGFVNSEDQAVLKGAHEISTAADTSSPAGSYPITLAAGNLSSNNYDISYVNGTLTVTKATATPALTVASLSGTYSGTALDASATTIPAGLTVEMTYTDANGNPVANPTSAGTYTVIATINDTGYSGSTTGALTIAKANQSISFLKQTMVKTYGTADFGPGATATSGLAVTYASSDITVATVTQGGLVHIVGAGTATITATQAGNENWNAASAAQTLTVEKAKLTVTANNASRDAGTADPVFTATYGGFVNGEGTSVITGAPSFTTTATSTSPGGSYPVTPAIGTLSAINYDFSFAPGTLAVGLASQTITFNPLQTRRYGNAPFELTATGGATGNPVAFSSSNTTVATVAGSTVTIVGTGETVITASQEGGSGYAEASAQQTLTVKPATLLVQAVNARREYGTPDPVFTVTYSGFVYSDDATALTGTPAITTTATSSSPTGSYKIIPAQGTLSSANYNFIFSPATLAVDLAIQNITFNPLTHMNYGDAPLNPGALGDSSGNPVTYTSSDQSVAVVNSDQTITITGVGEALITANQAGDYNYASATAQQILTVNPAQLTVSANYADRVYGAANPVLTASYAGFVNNDDQTKLTGAPVLATTAVTTSPAGSYPITVAAGNLFSTNYTFTYEDGTLTVWQATPAVVWNNPAPIVFGTALGSAQLNATANVAGTFDYAPPAGTILGAGAGQSLAVTFTPDDTVNYTGATANVSINVSKAGQTITFGPAPDLAVGSSATVSATATAGLPVIFATITPLVCTVAGTTVTAWSIGSCVITADQAGDVNYNAASQATQTITVGKGTATITLINLSQTYDGAAKAALATTVPSGLPVTFTYDGSATEPTNAGTYVVVATASAANYTGTASANLTIARADQSVSFQSPAVTKAYGDADFGPSATATSGLGITYTSDNPSVATITASGLVHITGAGTATITASQAGAANYNPATATQTLTVAKASLTVTANNASRAYGVDNPAFTASYGGFAYGNDASVLSGAPAFSTTADINSPTGSYAITPATGTLAATNYDFTFADGTLAVGIASQNMVFNPLSAKTYGAAPFDLTATGGGSGNPVTFASSNPAVATVNGSTVTITGAGTAVITASQDGNSNYAPATARQTLTVNPATLLVSAANAARLYGEADPPFTVTYTGFVNNENETVLSGAPVITTTATGSSTVGSYPITPAQGTLAAANYTFIFSPGTLGVDVTSQNITFNQIPVVTYGAAAFDLTATGGGSGLPVTYASSNTAVVQVNGTTVTITGAGQAIITATQAGDANYASATAQQILTVNPATVTVKAADAVRVYGAANPVFSVTYSGFVNNEDQSKLAGAPALATTADTTSVVGNYLIAVESGNLFSTNYTFSYEGGSLTIGQATPVITWGTPAAIIYGMTLGDTQFNATADVAGTFSYAPSAGTALNAGAGQTLAATFTPVDTTNYSGATGSVTIDVVKAGQSITFGATPAVAVGGTGQVSATGGASANEVVFSSTTPTVCTVSSTTVTAMAAGVCTITADQADTANYNAAPQATQSITVGKGTATVTLGNLSQTYDGTAKSATATTVPAGLAVIFTYDGAATVPTNAGSYAVVATVTDANYTGTASGTLVVGAGAQVVTFANATVNKIYGNADFDPGASATSGLGVIYTSDNTSVATITTGGLIHIAGAGTATITATQAGNSNYTPATAAMTMIVGKATLTVTATSASRVSGAADPAFSATYSGFVNGESATVITGAPTFTTTDSGSPVGSYPITPALGTLSAANYSFTFAPGTLAISIASQSIVFNPLNAKTYGAAPFDLSATGGGSGNPVTFASSNPAVATVNGQTVTITGAGTVVITATQAGSSSFASATAQQILTVNPATLLVSAANAARFYGEADPPFTVTYTGFVNNENETVLSGAPVITTTATGSSTVGSYPITPAAGTLASANYTFIFSPGTLGVDVVSQNITFGQIPVATYGAVPFDLAATGGGSGNPVTYTSSNTAVVQVNGTTVTITGAGQAIITASQAGDVNYASATAQQFMTVNPATVTVKAADAGRVYGAANPVFSVTYSGFVNSEDQSRLAGVPALATIADTTSIAGSYPITVESGNLFSTNYTFSYEGGSLTIGQATPVITWVTPAAIGYGTALGSSQLNATTGVAGTFTYTPAAGDIMSAGAGQTLTTTFSPVDSVNYIGATATANINVTKGGQSITFGAVPAVVVGGSGTISATVNSGLEVTFTSTTPAICTVSGATITGVSTGTCAITATQAGNGNYLAATASQNMTVVKNTASITLGNLNQTYDGTAKAVSASTVPFGLTVTFAYGGAATVPVNAGTYAVVATISDAAYTGSASGTLVIGGGTQTITFAGATVTKNYGNADFGPGATASTGLAVTYTSDNHAVAIITTGGLIHVTGAGTATITATQAGNTNYNQATATMTLTVEKATLTVTATNAARAFGAAEPVFSASYSGFVNGETVAVLSGSPAFSTTADSGSPVGSYPLTPGPGTLAATNYSFTFAMGTLAVGIASQTVVFNPLASKTYGAASFDLTATGGGSGNPVTFASSNPAVATVDGQTVTITGAGSADITASQDGNSNYASATARQALTVNPAPLLVSAVNAERFFGETNPVFSVTYTGFVNGENQSVLTGAPVVTTTATSSSAVGSYPVTPAQGTLASVNYSFTFVPGAMGVDVASQNISFSRIPAMTYGAAAFDPTAVGGGSGNPVTFTSSNPAVAAINGATVTITGVGQAIVTASQAGNANYAPATAQQILTVTPATITVTAVDASRVYGAANPSFNVTYSGFVNNEDQSKLAGAPALATTADATSTAGTYPITVAAGNLFSNNYAFTYFNGTLTVGQATPVITWSTPAAITYGVALGETQLNATSNVAGTFSYVPSAGTVLNAGKGQTLTAIFTPADTVNYSGTTGSVTIDVAKAGQTISFGAAPALLVGGTGTVSASGGASANAVLFSSLTPEFCSVTGATVTGITAGVCTIAADQAGNANFTAASQVTQIIQSGKLVQTITFGSMSILRLGDADSDPGASASSGLAVSYTSSNPAVVTIVNNKLHVTGLGTSTITVSQPGNATFLAATSVSQALTVGYNTTPPTLIVSALSDGAITTETTQNISGTAYDINGIASVTVNGVSVKVNADGSFSYPVQLLTGSNAITVIVTNNAGVTTTNTRTITLDSTSAKLTVTYPPDNAVAIQQSITVTGTVADLLSGSTAKNSAKTVALDSTVTSVSYTVNGSSPQIASLTDTTYSFAANLGDGMNTIRVSATTSAGKTVEAKRTITYQPAFSIAITDPASDARLALGSYNLNGTVTDNSTPVAVTVTMDGQSYTPTVTNGVFQQQLSFTEDKTYQISVTGVDQNNNSLTVQRNIIHALPKAADGTTIESFTIVDALLSLQMAVGTVTPSTAQTLRMDVAPMVNGVSVGDGKIDVEDVLVILYMAIGLI